jgi:hypothetical protein
VTEHTTTEAEVRECFQASAEGLDFKRVYYERGETFDRWLAEVKAEALREAAEALRAEDMAHDRWYAEGLERRADRIIRLARGEGA